MKSRFLFAILFSILSFKSFAQNSEIKNDLKSFSQNIEVLLDNNQATLLNPRFNVGNGKITAKYASVDVTSQVITLKEQVSYTSNNFVVFAEKAEFFIKKQKLIFVNASFYDAKNQVYATVDELTRESDVKYVAKGGYLTRCTPDRLAWFFEFNELNIEIENYALGHGVFFNVYGTPVLYLPVFAFPTTSKRKSGFLMPSLASTSSNANGYGTKISAPYFINFNDDNDLTFSPEIYSFRGIAYAFEYNYAFTDGMRGQLSSWLINESFTKRKVSEENLMLDTDQIHPTRYYLDYYHRQKIFGGSSQLFITSNLQSDNEVKNDYIGGDTANTIKKNIRIDEYNDIGLGSVTLFAEDKQKFENRSRYNQDVLTTTLVEKYGASAQYTVSNILFSTFSLDVKTDYIEFDRIEGFRGNYKRMQTKLDFYYAFLSGSLSAYITNDFHAYDANYSTATVDTIKRDYNYNFYTKNVRYDFYLNSYYNGATAIKYSMNPYVYFTERDDYQARGSLNNSPGINLDYSYYDYENYNDIFSNEIKLSPRRSVTLGLKYSIDSKQNQIIKHILDLDIYASWNFLRSSKITNNSSYFKGPIVTEDFQETKVNELLTPFRIQLNYYPIDNFSIASFLRFDYRTSHFNEKTVNLNFGKAGESLTSIGYSANIADYKDLDGYPHPRQESLSAYRDVLFTSSFLVSVSGSWNFLRRDIEPTPTTNRLSNILTSANINLRYIHCCYTVDFGYQETISTRTVPTNVSQEYANRSFYIRLSLLPGQTAFQKTFPTGNQ